MVDISTGDSNITARLHHCDPLADPPRRPHQPCRGPEEGIGTPILFPSIKTAIYMDKKDIDTHLSMKTGQNMDKTDKNTHLSMKMAVLVDKPTDKATK